MNFMGRRPLLYHREVAAPSRKYRAAIKDQTVVFPARSNHPVLAISGCFAIVSIAGHPAAMQEGMTTF
jgi:hypothetical protein